MSGEWVDSITQLSCEKKSIFEHGCSRASEGNLGHVSQNP